MSLGVGLLIGFAFFIFLNTIFGGNTVNQQPTNQVDKDVERLREIADYDRWEDGRRKDS